MKAETGYWNSSRAFGHHWLSSASMRGVIVYFFSPGLVFYSERANRLKEMSRLSDVLYIIFLGTAAWIDSKFDESFLSTISLDTFKKIIVDLIAGVYGGGGIIFKPLLLHRVASDTIPRLLSYQQESAVAET